MKYGIVRHVPGTFPEWVGPAHCAEQADAEKLAETFNNTQRNSQCLRWPNGTRYYAVKQGSAYEITRQFERIVEARHAR